MFSTQLAKRAAEHNPIRSRYHRGGEIWCRTGGANLADARYGGKRNCRH